MTRCFFIFFRNSAELITNIFAGFNVRYSIHELMEGIGHHQSSLDQTGKRSAKNLESLKNEITDILSERLSHSVLHQFETSSGLDVLAQLVNREIDPYQAADLISGN